MDPPRAPDGEHVPVTSSIIATLTGKLIEERDRNRKRITELEEALAAAHSGILLQRQQGLETSVPDPATE